MKVKTNRNWIVIVVANLCFFCLVGYEEEAAGREDKGQRIGHWHGNEALPVPGRKVHCQAAHLNFIWHFPARLQSKDRIKVQVSWP